MFTGWETCRKIKKANHSELEGEWALPGTVPRKTNWIIWELLSGKDWTAFTSHSSDSHCELRSNLMLFFFFNVYLLNHGNSHYLVQNLSVWSSQWEEYTRSPTEKWGRGQCHSGHWQGSPDQNGPEDLSKDQKYCWDTSMSSEVAAVGVGALTFPQRVCRLWNHPGGIFELHCAEAAGPVVEDTSSVIWFPPPTLKNPEWLI